MEEVLSKEAVEFVEALHQRFNAQRLKLLQERKPCLGFLAETEDIRNDLIWRVAPPPEDLKKRRVEITGPVERKMIINALNSGADVFMADFEDALSPTWENVLIGQKNLIDAVNRTIDYETPDGKLYHLKDSLATLIVRPRGWHLEETHLKQPLGASFFDFGLYFFHNAHKLLKRGTAPYFYLPKMESYLEARLWKDVFIFAENELGIPQGTIRVTVLVETLSAAFQMEEILYELKEYGAGLNAGRWDYIFSIIKTFQHKKDFVFPDRSAITMNAPFMKAYTSHLVATCAKRGAQAIGGMAAFIPNRTDLEVTKKALEKVREDKEQERVQGFIGSWVAHPDLVSIVKEVFSKPLQPAKKAEGDLLDFTIPGGKITEEGLSLNIHTGLLYLQSWLNGQGAVAISNLMEDTATAEICRAEVWQWIQSPLGKLSSGEKITSALVKSLVEKEAVDQDAKKFFLKLTEASTFLPFLTLMRQPL